MKLMGRIDRVTPAIKAGRKWTVKGQNKKVCHVSAAAFVVLHHLIVCVCNRLLCVCFPNKSIETNPIPCCSRSSHKDAHTDAQW